MKWLSILLSLTVTVANAQEREPSSLSPEDQRTLERGEISTQRYVIGGVVGSVVGLGIGHTIQGRYHDAGWIFTTGEAVSYGLLFAAIISCFGDRAPGTTCHPPVALEVLGIGGLVGFHIWEVIDLWTKPPEVNARYHQLRRKHHSDWGVFPTVVDNRAGLGVVYSF